MENPETGADSETLLDFVYNPMVQPPTREEKKSAVDDPGIKTEADEGERRAGSVIAAC